MELELVPAGIAFDLRDDVGPSLSRISLLGVSVNTFAFHIKNIYQKLQVHSKSQAVAKALRDGIV